MFPAAGAGNERRAVRVHSAIQGHVCVAAIELFLQPNPYMMDGQTFWLSDDLRVFQIRPGGTQSGITFPAPATPEGYLQTFLAACDATADAAGHPFRQISMNQYDSRLELSNQVDDEPVYNFAVARMHYKSVGTPAPDVRLFFRAFTTAATSMEYRPETYPWDPATNLPQVGANATDVLSIPFYSVPRATVGTSGDTQNVKTLPASGAGGETLRYFGAWLDINATAPAITDPADGVVKSVQDHIRGNHQCLVAEIRFGPDAIPVGATPASNENLSQRNLAIVESDNPGLEDSHTVAHTFQLKTTLGAKDVELQAAARNRDHTGDDIERPRRELADPTFDELMIFWGGVPGDSVATVYLPAFRADDILAAAAMRYDASHLAKVDEHTIRCRVGDVSWVPLPTHEPRQVAGLVSIVLPPTVKTGEQYRVQIRQHSPSLGRIVGTFELLIVVRDGPDIFVGEARLLAVLKSIACGIRPTSAWFDVFQRYVAIVSNRVRGVGGDPTKIGPSPEGFVSDSARPSRSDRCYDPWRRGKPRLHRLRRLGFGLALLLGVSAAALIAIFVVLLWRL
jgi:hypothetical protein